MIPMWISKNRSLSRRRRNRRKGRRSRKKKGKKERKRITATIISETF